MKYFFLSVLMAVVAFIVTIAVICIADPTPFMGGGL